MILIKKISDLGISKESGTCVQNVFGNVSNNDNNKDNNSEINNNN